ncbi:MAG TPA: heme lyase CcmF/NrfE family subunit [Acidimicrobiales bacterium]|nr:heme lyase CcmF/NrfE family subunit [Acidimicrobiales bacterium]
MNGAVGHAGVVLALLAACAGIVTISVGLATRRDSLVVRARGYVYLLLAGLLVATGAMEHALVTHDFSIAFVAHDNSRETPLLFSVTGMWSGLQGSVLLWALILAGYIAFAAHRFRARATDPVVAWALLVSLAVATFFLALMLGPSDPFAATVGAVPPDGTGPNALLQDNLLIAFHPVFLYLGLVGFTLPYGFAIASLVTGRVGEGWLSETRRFTLFAWAFLTVGIVLGAWWSYQELGWGGFWGWDPVENAALLPWLTGTAYLHSAMVQERRGLLRVWNISLVIATFSLTILGTFLTRSGITQSVHSFSSSGVGPALIGLFAAAVAAGVGLIGWRGDRLRSPGSIDSPVSREGAFLVNNLLFAAFAAVVLLGTVFPLVVQAIDNQSLSIGRPFFDAFTVPIGIALLFLMSVAPALPWRKAAPGVLRERLAVPAWIAALVLVACVAGGVRGLTPLVAFTLGAFAASVAGRQLVLAARVSRRHGFGAWRGIVGRANGGMVVHIGIVVIAVGLTAATSFAHSTELAFHPGESVRFDGHVLTFERWARIVTANEVAYTAVFLVDGARFAPGIGSFNGSAEGTDIPAVDSSLVDDVYLSVGNAPVSPRPGQGVTVDVYVQPLVMWLWAGGAVTASGAVLAAVPGRRRRPTDPSSAPPPELADARRVPAATHA